ncbi:MAG TPA: lamin tail domain-containing protein [Pyrinomonadaceae bacterium]|nr:lamin tail domain-containing protein [Pyrinomonadaceae bacterium]
MSISEFRLRGPNGSADEFVEIYNHTNTPITVSTSDGSAGWSLVSADGVIRFTIPNGTVIPARGHYLGANTGYSLSNHPAGNGVTAVPDINFNNVPANPEIADNTGIALFKTANSSNFTAANVLDAVGFTGVNPLYSRGTPLQSIGTAGGEYSFVRKALLTGQPGGVPQDTNNNADDFLFVSTTGAAFNGVASVLGAPGPENLSSPRLNSDITPSLIDPVECSNCSPNLARLFCGTEGTPSCEQNTSSLGFLSVRRKFTNNTGQTLTRLRFRIIDITNATYQAGLEAPVADLRALTSTQVLVNSANVGPITVKGTTLETPPEQALGGGINSSLSAGDITLATPLPATGSIEQRSINLQFLLGVKSLGRYRFFVLVEALTQNTEAALAKENATLPVVKQTKGNKK